MFVCILSAAYVALSSPEINCIVYVLCINLLGLAQQRNVASPALVGEAHQVSEPGEGTWSKKF